MSPERTREDSFIEPWFKVLLKWVDQHGCFTELMMRLAALLPLKTKLKRWAGEDFAYLAGLSLTYSILALTWLGSLGGMLGTFAVVYVVVRLVDIFSYELKIIFVDPDNVKKGEKHLLSARRRVLLTFLRFGDFLGVFSLLYLAVQGILGANAFEPPIDSPVAAFYLSTVAGSFTGLATSMPNTDLARLAVALEILLGVLLLGLVLVTMVASVGPLSEMKKRPPRADS